MGRSGCGCGWARVGVGMGGSGNGVIETGVHARPASSSF